MLQIVQPAEQAAQVCNSALPAHRFGIQEAVAAVHTVEEAFQEVTEEEEQDAEEDAQGPVVQQIQVVEVVVQDRTEQGDPVDLALSL